MTVSMPPPLSHQPLRALPPRPSLTPAPGLMLPGDQGQEKEGALCVQMSNLAFTSGPESTQEWSRGPKSLPQEDHGQLSGGSVQLSSLPVLPLSPRGGLRTHLCPLEPVRIRRG